MQGPKPWMVDVHKRQLIDEPSARAVVQARRDDIEIRLISGADTLRFVEQLHLGPHDTQPIATAPENPLERGGHTRVTSISPRPVTYILGHQLEIPRHRPLPMEPERNACAPVPDRPRCQDPLAGFERLPTPESFDEVVDIRSRTSDVEVGVFARLASEPYIDGPASAHPPLDVDTAQHLRCAGRVEIGPGRGSRQHPARYRESAARHHFGPLRSAWNIPAR